MFLITGHFLDLRIEKNNIDTYRALVDFMNYLSASNPLLMNDSSGQLLKSSINFSRIDPANTKDSLSNKEWNEKGCCDINGFNYVYSVGEIGKGPGRNFSDVTTDSDVDPGKYFPYFNPKSFCYRLAGFMSVNSIDNPVDICYDRYNCTLGKGEMMVTKTPLSELTYWLSRACVATEQNFRKTILFDQDDVNYVELDDIKQEVCVHFNTGIRSICKKFECTGVGASTRGESDLSETERADLSNPVPNAPCFAVAVTKREGRTYFDNLFTSVRPIYNWKAPGTCYNTENQGGSFGDITSSDNLDTTPCGSLPTNACRVFGNFIRNVKSDTVYSGKGGVLVSCQARLYLDGASQPGDVSSASVSGHGYIWQSLGDSSIAAECCSGANCNSENDGVRIQSTSILSSSTVDGASAAAFNKAWCGFESKNCLLCAPDQADASRTRWYVCNGGTKSYDALSAGDNSGVQEIELGKNIGGHACGVDGWK